MDLSLSTHSVKNLLSFPFHDPEWKSKFLIGAAVSFAGVVVPVVPWLAIWGYVARLIRAGAANEDAAHLPVWDDWGELFTDGLRQFGVIMICLLPALVLMLGGWLFYMTGMVSFTTSGHNQASANGSALFMFASMIVFFIAMGLGSLLTLAAWLVMPAAQARVAVERRFSAAFEAKEWWRVLRANLGGFLLASGSFFVLQFTLAIIFQFFYMTVCLCPIGMLAMLPAGFYTLLIVYRLAGQAYGEGSAKLNVPALLPPDPLPAV